MLHNHDFAATRLRPAFALANRPAIEAEIERLLTLLDAADGDCDLEPESDHTADELRELEDWRPEGIRLPWPIYGVDQSAGPVNGCQVHDFYQRAQLAL